MGSLDTDEDRVPVPDLVELAYGLYPGVEFFSAEYGPDDYCEWVEHSNGDPVPAPLAVYIQDSSRDHSPPVRGRDISSSRKPVALEQELRLQGALFDADRCVQQLICAGSIAAEWTDDQLYRLVSVLEDSFATDQNGLVNWCACVGHALPSESRLRLLRVLGFSNVRLRILDPAGVPDGIESLAASARHLGMRQVGVELYMDAQQASPSSKWLESFVQKVQPDRIRLVDSNDAARRDPVRNLRDTCVQTLADMGYQHIGLDWFVRSSDLWWQARLARRLNWSLLGFTDMPRPDVIGVGPGAVSSIGDFYAQNACAWDEYQKLLSRGVIPTVRGLELESDDVLRREIMVSMFTASCIDITPIEDKWGIEFNQFFADELGYLKRFDKAGWISIKPQSIIVHARGRRELTELCRIFDRRGRLPRDQYAPSFA
jgi:oxygen-independent coproporphyrinogen-3 oxidase